MNVSIAEAKAHLPQFIRAVEGGEIVVITRHGRAVAEIRPLEKPKHDVVLGGMADRIKLLPGWDDPVDLDRFLDGEI